MLVQSVFQLSLIPCCSHSWQQPSNSFDFFFYLLNTITFVWHLNHYPISIFYHADLFLRFTLYFPLEHIYCTVCQQFMLPRKCASHSEFTFWVLCHSLRVCASASECVCVYFFSSFILKLELSRRERLMNDDTAMACADKPVGGLRF